MKVGLQLVISPWDAWIFKLDNFVSMQLRLCCSLHVRCQTLPSKFPWQERLRPGEVFVFTYTFTLIRMDSTCPTMILIFILPVFSWNAFPRISRRWWPTKWLPNSGRTASDGQTWSDPLPTSCSQLYKSRGCPSQELGQGGIGRLRPGSASDFHWALHARWWRSTPVWESAKVSQNMVRERHGPRFLSWSSTDSGHTASL